jgi:hypothetical protein
MLNLKLNYNEALELLNRVVEEKGADHVYQGKCVYFHGGAPACIIGHVMAYKGITPDDLEGNENSMAALMLDLGEDQKTRILLSIVQSKQDGGIPWGEAVADAVRYVETWNPTEGWDLV